MWHALDATERDLAVVIAIRETSKVVAELGRSDDAGLSERFDGREDALLGERALSESHETVEPGEPGQSLDAIQSEVGTAHGTDASEKSVDSVVVTPNEWPTSGRPARRTSSFAIVPATFPVPSTDAVISR